MQGSQFKGFMLVAILKVSDSKCEIKMQHHTILQEHRSNEFIQDLITTIKIVPMCLSTLALKRVAYF